MKKLLILTLALILTLSLLTACGGKNNGNNSTNPPTSQGNNETPGDNGNNGETGTGEASITPVSGWEKDENALYPIYSCKKEDGLGATITLNPPQRFPSDITGDKQYVEYILTSLKESFPDATFSDITQITVNGMEAYEYTMDSGIVVRTIYVCKDNKGYSIGCSYFGSDYDAVKDDFQNMLDSYTLKLG